MKTFFKICYIIWLGFCMLVFLMSLGMAHQASFFQSLLLAILLAISPYLYFLCIFKIPIDFEIYCIENKRNINDFVLFFKQNKLYLSIPIIAFALSIALRISLEFLFFILPFLWLYIIFIKKLAMFYLVKLWRL